MTRSSVVDQPSCRALAAGRPRRAGPAAMMLAVAFIVAGCGYGNVSPRCYEYANAIYAICNRRLDDKLAVAKKGIEDDLQAQRIPEKEAKWLLDIIGDAERGEWTGAMKQARAIVQDQTSS